MNRWQFSTRHLLVLTAIVSVILAVAVRMPAVFQIALMVAAPVLFIIAVFQSANFATSDRRPRLAAISWSLMATFFALFALLCFGTSAHARKEMVGFPVFLGLTMAGCCLVCIHQALLSIRTVARKLGRHSKDNDNASGGTAL